MTNLATTDHLMCPRFEHMLSASRQTIIKLLDENTQPKALGLPASVKVRRRHHQVRVKCGPEERTGQGTPASTPGA